jgi:cell division protein FtsI/penicillin-binding protein 2
VGDEVRALSIPGVNVDRRWARTYPEGQLAAHLLGFANEQGHGYGIEARYHMELEPTVITRSTGGDIYRDQLPWEVAPVEFSQPGVELTLSIDRDIQALVEEELARSLAEYQAESGTIVVLDPHTFQVLAMASAPSYPPENYTEYLAQDPSPFPNPAISMQYEPGSVFKIVTVAAALDSGLATPDTTYEDRGAIEYGGRWVSNAYDKAYGRQTISQAFVKSLNVGMVWLVSRIGNEEFYSTVEDFGFGEPTDVDLAGEIGGRVVYPDDETWRDETLAQNAFGQGVAVTPLQMTVAVATIANDGVRLRPRVVRMMRESDGATYPAKPVFEQQVVSTNTARLVTEMMVRVIDEHVTQAGVPGYRIAGKTGTAQIPVPGGYDLEGSIASFAGFGPVPDPRFVILVKLDRPQTSQWGSQTAAFTFQRLAARLLVIMGVPPQSMGMAQAAGE